MTIKKPREREKKIKHLYKFYRNDKRNGHLNHTMKVYHEITNIKTYPNDDYIIPPRKFYNELRGDVIVEWKDDRKFVTS